MKKTLHIDYVTFGESGKSVAYAPKLELCFNGVDSEKSVEYLREGVKAQLDFWKEKNQLGNKVLTLGLNGTTTPTQNEEIKNSISVPFSLLAKSDMKSGVIDLEMEY